MKRFIVMMISLLVLLSVVCSVGFGSVEDFESESISDHIYAKLGVIVDFDYTEDLVLVSDWNGDIWTFTGIEDWAIWDYVDLVFHDNGTPGTIYDDVILSATYERVDLVQAQVLESIRNRLPQYH